MLFVRKNWLLPVILFSIGTSIFVQFLFPQAQLLTVACLDGFGAGAFLAWALIYKPQFIMRTKRLWVILAVAGVGFQLLRLFGASIPIPSRTLTAFVTIWVILKVVKEQRKPMLLNFILNNRVLIFIGKISYGIYLYHFIIPYYSFRFLDKFNQLLPEAITKYNFYLFRLENLCLVILLAYLSWKLIEQPVLTLKKHFDYKKPIALETESAIAAVPTTKHHVERKTIQKEFETF
jgi:peptidoglycan/LPS O-acetylase OafA/YrhL